MKPWLVAIVIFTFIAMYFLIPKPEEETPTASLVITSNWESRTTDPSLTKIITQRNLTNVVFLKRSESNTFTITQPLLEEQLFYQWPLTTAAMAATQFPEIA